MAEPGPRGEMPFLDHLEELRRRLLVALTAVVVGSVVGWFVLERVDVIAILKAPIAPYLPDGRLVFTSPVEPFLLTLKLAFIVGLILASPVVLWQAWAFLAPALYQREKRVILPALASGVFLFALGAAAAYFWVLPAGLRVLLSFQRADLAPFVTANAYFGFAAQVMIAFGVVTELPLLIVILAFLGLVTPGFLSRNRRYALVVSAVLAAALTPPDVLSMLMMMVPLVLLYEISIVGAWVVTRRRLKRAAASGATAALLVTLLAGSLGAQQPRPLPPSPRDRPPAPQPAPPPRAGQQPAADTAAGRPALDTAAARRLGLPTSPSRTFPDPDSLIQQLLTRQGYRITRYAADTLVLTPDSQEIVLRRNVLVEREGTTLEADSVRYLEGECRLDATGQPKLFDQGSVMVGDRMRYDTCIRRGLVAEALTDYDQGGVTWYVRGDLAVDSDSSRIFASRSAITSDPRPMPSYHFAARQMKWLDKNIMVARPAVLYVRDVPVMWLPFIFQDIRKGRRSGMLVPQFGLNDLVRPTRGYERHVANIGYYFAFSDYLDALIALDWYAGRYLEAGGQVRYRWLDRFLSGTLSYRRQTQLDAPARSSQVTWYHHQSFSSRANLTANINYATSATVLQRNSVDPYLATAQLTSNLNFSRRFDWGTLNVGGSRSQELTTDRVSQTFPSVSLTPSPIAITSLITWSPGFSLSTTRVEHQAAGSLLVPGPGGLVDTLPLFSQTRTTSIAIGTPLRIGRWNWTNRVSVEDARNDVRQELVLPDPTDSTALQHTLYGTTFQTGINWETSFGLPPLFPQTWRLQPSVGISNRTGGPFAVRNQNTGGEWVTQGKRLSFTVSSSPAFFGFFPGIGPLARIRHSVQPLISYLYAPGTRVPEAYARAIDPTGRRPNLRSDPQQTITFGLAQNVEGKFREAPRDTGAAEGAAPPAPRKIKLLSLQTSAIVYNFEQAKLPGRTGWQTQTLNNVLSSELIPGLSLNVTHDLWDGTVGLDTTRFAPFLTSVTTQFTITGRTVGRLFGALGLGGLLPAGEAEPAEEAARDTTGDPSRGAFTQRASYRANQYFRGGFGGGGGFSLAVGYTSTRTRPRPGLDLPGDTRLSLSMAFSPSPKWQVHWNTNYSFATGQFDQHVLQLERDLDRWHASFAFVKSPNGNFAFNFAVALRDQPDIKFDYDQRSILRQ